MDIFNNTTFLVSLTILSGFATIVSTIVAILTYIDSRKYPTPTEAAPGIDDTKDNGNQAKPGRTAEQQTTVSDTRMSKLGWRGSLFNWFSKRFTAILLLLVISWSVSIFTATLSTLQLADKIAASAMLLTEDLEEHQEAALLTLEASEATAKKDFQAAHETLKKAVSTESDNPYILKRLADAENNLGLYESALKNYEAATRIRDDYKAAYQGQVMAHYNLRRYDTAIHIFNEKLLNNSPSARDLYVGGKAYSLKWASIRNYSADDSYQTAKSLYTSCLQSDTSWRRWCYYNLACLEATRLSDPSVGNNSAESQILSDSAIRYLTNALDEAGSLKEEMKSYICTDATLNNIKGRIGEVVDCDNQPSTE